MKYFFLLISFSFLFSFTVFARNEKKNVRVLKGGPVIKIIGDNRDEFIRVPPPEEFLNKSAGETQGLPVKVNYYGFTPEAKNAFQYAVDIWASLLGSSVEIVIDAYWSRLQTGVLGNCGATNYYRNYDGMPDDNVFYPLALAEKLHGQELNDPGEADMEAEFSSLVSWYYGTDGATPPGRHDLVTVVLHELCHGLGFIGSFAVENGLGFWGWGMDSPFAFDQFVTDVNRKKLVDEANYPNNSVELMNALTSGALFFDSPVLMGTNRAKANLYAPNIWADNSSVYHLGTSYLEGPNALMCSSIGTAKSIHDPGIITKSILADMGWKQIQIKHEPLKNSETVSDVELVAQIVPDNGLQLSKPIVSYSIDSADYVDIEMALKKGNMTRFYATIPVSHSANISYNISITDQYERKFKLPVTSPEINYQFFIGQDTIPPEIKHYYNTFLLPGQDSINMQAYVTDAFGVDSVWIAYSVNGAEKPSVGLKLTKNDKYEMTLDLKPYNLKVGDSVSYRLLARDVSKAKNVGVKPDSGLITMKVEAIPDFITTFENPFELGNSDFILQGFEISTPDGFNNGALHTIHPYEFAGEASSLEYIAQLRYPVKIDSTYHFIEFDEIVLVEPGEPDTKYGDDEFWDYVIVEASKDEGRTWIPLEPGWDSRFHGEWLTAYTQSIREQFSQAVGKPEMYKRHLINILNEGSLGVGDEVLIRFRLYSDPYANGWGWAIDNLKIQTIGLSVPVLLSRYPIRVYPNPVKNHELFIESGAEPFQQITIYNFSGIKVCHYYGDGENKISLPEYLQGGYIVVIKTKTTTSRTKIIIE